MTATVHARTLIPLCLLAVAAPGAALAAPGDALSLDAQLFAGLEAASDADDSRATYELGRGELGLRGDFAGGAGFELRLETVRSAAPDSLFGVDGDSLVVRAKRAWGRLGWAIGPARLELRLGLLPDPWIEALELGYSLRAVSPLAAERGDFFDTSDLGAGVVVTWRFVRLALVTSNGEGRNQIELNDGKNTSAVLTVAPWSGGLGPLGPVTAALHLGARDGSLGLGSAQDRRLAAGATLQGPRLDVGLEWVAARGYQGQGSRDAMALGAWASGAIYARALGAFGRFDLIDGDTRLDDSSRRVATLGLWSEPLAHGRSDGRGVRLLLAVQDERADSGAPPFPGSAGAGDVRRVMLIVSVTGSWLVAGTEATAGGSLP